MSGDLFQLLVSLGDDRLILGHRLSEWCAHGPLLEEDIALGNIALDSLGHAVNFLQLAGTVEGRGRTEDDLAYFRECTDFRNALLVEQPNGDFARTMVRQFLYDGFAVHYYESLAKSSHPGIQAIAGKAVKEVRYHIRHSGEWLLRLGNGTDESRWHTQLALDELWPYTGELFEPWPESPAGEDLAADPNSIRGEWESTVLSQLHRAGLTVSTDTFQQSGGRRGFHSEHLGHLLSEMQIVARSFPGVTW